MYIYRYRCIMYIFYMNICIYIYICVYIYIYTYIDTYILHTNVYYRYAYS